jgi:hypothetical protein
MTEMIEPMPAAIDLARRARDRVERTRAATNFTPCTKQRGAVTCAAGSTGW